jgi:hypothetical protein
VVTLHGPPLAVPLAGLALVLVLLPSRAAAQAPSRATLGLSYGYLREAASDGATYDAGWFASVASRPRSSLSWVGEVGGSYRSPAGVTQQLLSCLGGARLSHRQGSIAPFVQAVAGIERFSEPGFSETGLALQPGGGIDVSLTARLALRAQVDYRWVRIGANSTGPAVTIDEWRFGVGVAIGLGG